MTAHLGVLASSSHIRYAITQAVAGLPYTVACPDPASALEMDGFSDVDIWVLAALDIEEPLLATVGQQCSHVLVLDEDIPSVANAGFNAWQRRLQEKLAQSTRRLARGKGCGQNKAARELWLLAASAGGLNAVVDFLKSIPSSLPDIGFLYAQHMDVEQQQHVVDVIDRATDWRATIARDGEPVCADSVVVVSPAVQTGVAKTGDIKVLDSPWRGRYKPNIDCLAADVASGYGAKSGMIVFTGMGNDGARGSQFISKCGGQVWVQSPESCIASSMPEAVLARGCDVTAGVGQLAEKFTDYYSRRMAL